MMHRWFKGPKTRSPHSPPYKWGLEGTCLLLLAFIMACGPAATATPTRQPAGAINAEFPVNETFAADLTAKGIPTDLARFFAAAKMEPTNPDPNTFVYHLFYPNGATREITMKFTPNQQHTPTPEETAKASPGGSPIYAFQYENTLGEDWTGRLDMSYFVPNAGIPKELLSHLKKTSFPWYLATTASASAPNAPESGAGVAWGESAKEGADVAIGSVIDHFKDKGLPNAGKIAGVYALASAASDLSDAIEIAKQSGKWLTELDALEECAANPTNQVAKSAPNYSKDAVAKVQSARKELKEVNAVRFLNQMTDTGAGATPATAVMAIGLKQGFVWSEQTLTDYSENTIMREARLTVVACGDPANAAGNVDVLTESTYTWKSGQVDTVREHIVSNVSWVWNPAFRQYVSQGDFTFERTETSTANGKTCTTSMSRTGSLTNTGVLTTIDDLGARQLFGFGYSAGGFVETTVAASHSCPGTSMNIPYTIEWLPNVTGFPGTGGSIEGERTDFPAENFPAEGRTKRVKYQFSVPGK